MFDSIPAGRREAACAALRTTFGAAAVSSLKPIAGGASALVYRIDVGDRPYLLRLESLERDDVHDPERAYLCMRRAAEAGIAPAVCHVDAPTGVAIMDFVASHPLSGYPGGVDALARDLGHMARRLQATPTFPPIALDYPAVLAGLFERLSASNLFAPGLLDPHQEGFERLCEAYSWDSAALVSSHSDPHPENILFDGERLWLVDWETACANDPLLDIAVFTMYLAASPELEDILVRSWLGGAPDRVLRARLILMRQFARFFYACASALHAVAAEPHVRETKLVAPTPAEFRAAVTSGGLVAGTPHTHRVGCKVAFRKFLEGLARPGFEEALVVARCG